MKNGKDKNPNPSRLKALWKFISASIIAAILAFIIAVMANIIIVIIRYWPKIVHHLLCLVMASVIAVLPITPSLLAADSQTGDTNVYAAVFICPNMAIPMNQVHHSSFVPTISYQVSGTTNGPVSILNGPTIQPLPDDFDFDALSNALQSSYGITIDTNVVVKNGFYSSFGMNGLSVSNMPSISFDPNTGQVTVSNSSSAMYTVVCLRNSDGQTNWTPICTNVVPAGYTVYFSDGNAPENSGFYRLAVSDATGSISIVANGIKPRMALFEACGVAIVFIVIGTYIFIKLYYLCKQWFPPLPPEETNNPAIPTPTNQSLIMTH